MVCHRRLHLKQGAPKAGDHEQALKRGVDVARVAQVIQPARRLLITSKKRRESVSSFRASGSVVFVECWSLVLSVQVACRAQTGADSARHPTQTSAPRTLTRGSVPKPERRLGSLCHSPFFLNPFSAGTQPHRQFGFALLLVLQLPGTQAGTSPFTSCNFCSADTDPDCSCASSSRSACWRAGLLSTAFRLGIFRR